MIKCIVIDDEPVAIEILADYVSKLTFLELAGSFRDPVRALEFVRCNKVDLIFLDINMPGLSGIDFLQSLDRPPLVVFTTAHAEYAVESYDFEAVDYLLKPIEFDRFMKAAGRALARFEAESEPAGSVRAVEAAKVDLVIKSGSEYHRIDTNDILYVKAAGNYVVFVTMDREVMSLMNMGEALGLLPHGRFIRIHRSYIVSFDKVDVINSEFVTVRGEQLPIGETYRDELFRKIKST